MHSRGMTMCHLFSEKGKSECWKVVQKNNRFVNTLSLLGQVGERENET